MYRIINRTKGLIILPSKVLVGSKRSALVEEIDAELEDMRKKKLITIHDVKEKDCCWTKICIDPLCTPKNDGSPDLVPLDQDEQRKYGALALSFSNGHDTGLCFEVELPPNYVKDSDLKPTIDWKIKDKGNYGNVTWVVEFNALNNWIVFKKDELVYSTPIPLEQEHVLMDLPKIPGGGFKYNTLIKGRLIRLGSQDTYNLPAIIPSFTISYQVTRDKSITTWKAL